jgi:hypothetical protein
MQQPMAQESLGFAAVSTQIYDDPLHSVTDLADIVERYQSMLQGELSEEELSAENEQLLSVLNRRLGPDRSRVSPRSRGLMAVGGFERTATAMS